MRRPWLRPGAGFVLWVATTAGALALFGWGARTPPLERAHGILLDLKIGERGPLDERERALLEGVLRRYPRVAADVLDGAAAGVIGADGRSVVERDCAYLVRMGDPAAVVLELALPVAEERPVEVRLSAAGASITGLVGPGAPLSWPLPSAGGRPQLVEIRQPANGDHVPLAVQVRESR